MFCVVLFYRAHNVDFFSRKEKDKFLGLDRLMSRCLGANSMGANSSWGETSGHLY